MKLLLVMVVLGLGVLGRSQAAIDLREFADDDQRERYHDLAERLHCPECQGQRIGDSDSPANGLRGEI
jgi:cytochrome c-type biogenesis protein CcmH